MLKYILFKIYFEAENECNHPPFIFIEFFVNDRFVVSPLPSPLSSLSPGLWEVESRVGEMRKLSWGTIRENIEA